MAKEGYVAVPAPAVSCLGKDVSEDNVTYPTVSSPTGKSWHRCSPGSLKELQVWRWMAGLLAVCTTLLAAQTWTLQTLVSLGRIGWGPLVSTDCVLPLGGGPAQKGGSFPHFSYASCKPQIDTYFKDGGEYYTQVKHVADSAIAYLKDRMQHTPATKQQVFVFDIDETALSNKAEWTRPGRSLDQQHNGCRKHGKSATVTSAPGQAQPFITPESLRGLSEEFSPPLEAVQELYYFVLASGYSAAFITGRKEPGRKYTERNLAAAGYGQPCGSPDVVDAPRGWSGSLPALLQPADVCYVALHLRDNTDDRPASVYKPERRQALEDAGYEVVGNIGDQFSDLEGLNTAESSWKLPNPIYYIL